MRPSLRTCLSLFLASCLVAVGCGGGSNSNSIGSAGNVASGSSVNSAKTTVEDLGLRIALPYELDDVVWKEYIEQKRLVAVMRVTPADAAKLIADASATGPAESVSIPVQAWFPQELVAQGEISGDNTLKGQAYPANSFFQEPYMSGRVARVEGTDYFVLDVTAK
jgi:hypothetical protein